MDKGITYAKLNNIIVSTVQHMYHDATRYSYILPYDSFCPARSLARCSFEPSGWHSRRGKPLAGKGQLESALRRCLLLTLSVCRPPCSFLSRIDVDCRTATSQSELLFHLECHLARSPKIASPIGFMGSALERAKGEERALAG